MVANHNPYLRTLGSRAMDESRSLPDPQSEPIIFSQSNAQIKSSYGGSSCLRERLSAYGLLSSLASNGYTLYLFTYSDLKTLLLPTVAFALLNAPVLCVSFVATPGWYLKSILRTTTWTWLNLLLFCLHNQRLSPAISEDTINKPWRPLPAQRLSQRDATNVFLVAYPVTFTVSAFLGGFHESVLLMPLNYWYNDLRGADSNFLLRNVLNACGFVCYAAGALEVALGIPLLPSLPGVSQIDRPCTHDLLLHPFTGQWLAIIGLVVFSTIQAQDLRDRDGDALRQRQTLPLLLGDGLSRWAVVIPMAICSMLCLRFWNVNKVGYAGVCSTGLMFGARTLAKRKVMDDKATFRIWSLWVIAIYALPRFQITESR